MRRYRILLQLKYAGRHLELCRDLRYNFVTSDHKEVSYMAILNLTKENFAQEVLQSDKTVLVDFYADWCGPCKMQGPVLEELANDRDDVKVCKLNIDEQRDLAIEYGVMSIPTLMIVKGGEVTYKEVGLTQRRELDKILG